MREEISPTGVEMTKHPYVSSVFEYARRPTRVVAVGKVLVGGDEPVRVQSMTTTPTWDAPATIDQIVRLMDVGCEIVRVTVPSKKDALALPEIREGLLKKGLEVPLVADIHFAPSLAMFCVDHVDKVRINPGNFVDDKKFQVLEYSDQEYNDEIKRLEDAFTPLVLKAKKQGISMRIGTNHGSLSDRILNRYGDTPLGMVESALEFVRICRANDYHELIMSMKASNPIVMIQAYRLLAAHMDKDGMDYPFHLGVTEAGDGLDARVKSAVGIGSLLADGIGDTVRVSLTEDPCAEVPVGFDLVKLIEGVGSEKGELLEFAVDPYQFQRRESKLADFGGLAYGQTALPRIEAEIAQRYREKGFEISQSATGDGIETLCVLAKSAADLEKLGPAKSNAQSMGAVLSVAVSGSVWRDGLKADALQGLGRVEFRDLNSESLAGPGFAKSLETLKSAGVGVTLRLDHEESLDAVALAREHTESLALVLPLESIRAKGLDRARRFIAKLGDAREPIIFSWEMTEADPILAPSLVLGGLFCDGLGDAIRVPARGPYDGVDPVNVAYTLLQATRYRTVRTEYVSCPSCGRTLFDLAETTKKIKELTGHLPNVTIAIMGCIVNGPGEMADADFGYVGWKPGKVDLWVGKEVVEKAIPEEEAPLRLVELLKKHGVWVEPAELVES